MAQPRNEHVQPVEGVVGGVPIPVAPAAGTVVELQDSSTTTEASIQQDGAVVPVLGEDAGAILIAGRDGANQFHLRMAQAAVAADETLRHALVRAAVSGIDSSAVAGVKEVAVEARSGTNWDGGLLSLIALGVAANLVVKDIASGNLQQISADTPANSNGRVVASARGIYANAVVTGIDNTAAAVLKPVEARAYSVKAAVAGALIGLLANTRPSVFVNGDDWRMLSGAADPKSTNQAFSLDIPARDNGWVASDGGRRFAVTDQTPGGTLTAGSATFDATKPLLMFRGAASVEIILRSLKLIVTSSLTARVVIAIDTADRFSAGGAAITPQNMNANDSTAYPGTSVLSNPTATAAGGGTRYLFNDRVLSAPSVGEWQSADAWKIKGTRTILVYVYDLAGLVAPVVEHDEDVEAV